MKKIIFYIILMLVIISPAFSEQFVNSHFNYMTTIPDNWNVTTKNSENLFVFRMKHYSSNNTMNMTAQIDVLYTDYDILSDEIQEELIKTVGDSSKEILINMNCKINYDIYKKIGNRWCYEINYTGLGKRFVQAAFILGKSMFVLTLSSDSKTNLNYTKDDFYSIIKASSQINMISKEIKLGTLILTCKDTGLQLESENSKFLKYFSIAFGEQESTPFYQAYFLYSGIQSKSMIDLLGIDPNSEEFMINVIENIVVLSVRNSNTIIYMLKMKGEMYDYSHSQQLIDVIKWKGKTSRMDKIINIKPNIANYSTLIEHYSSSNIYSFICFDGSDYYIIQSEISNNDLKGKDVLISLINNLNFIK